MTVKELSMCLQEIKNVYGDSTEVVVFFKDDDEYYGVNSVTYEDRVYDVKDELMNGMVIEI